MRTLANIGLVAVILGAVAAGMAQSNPPPTEVPLAPPARSPDAAERILEQAKAQRWHDLGIIDTAVSVYRRQLQNPALSATERHSVSMKLVDALLDQGDIAGAENALNSMQDRTGSDWNLRAGLVAAYQGRAAVRTHAADINPATLTSAEMPWWRFLQAEIAEMDGDLPTAESLFQEALRSTSVPAQQARFQLAREYVRLRMGSSPAEALEEIRARAEEYRGEPIGFEASRQYAIALFNSNRAGEALQYVRQQLAEIPQAEGVWRDRYRLLVRMIAGEGNEVGSNALRELLISGSDPMLQRIALQMLVREMQPQDLRALLDQLLLPSAPAHPIRDDLLAMRSELALDQGTPAGYDQAAADAADLLASAPASPWRPHARVALASAEWGGRRFLRAAAAVHEAREELPAGATKAKLAVLMAEAYFRAEDYRSAADGYAIALEERPPDIDRSQLIFQRVQAEIAATDFSDDTATGRAIDVLDAQIADPAFALMDRWRAEWNLARSLLAAGKSAVALGRVENLLAEGREGQGGDVIDPGFRLRMQWLQLRLSQDARPPADTVRLAEALAANGAGGNADAQTIGEVRSQAALIAVESYFDLGREDDAVRVMTGLRRDFPRSDAAAQSFIIHAQYADQSKGDTVQAIQLLNEMVQQFPSSLFAPRALYLAAGYERDRGVRESYERANERLESLVQRYPDSEYVILARLLQGDIMRDLGDNAAALRVYGDILSNPRTARRPDATIAELRMANILSGESRGSGPGFEEASSRYESVFNNTVASVDARVEAGYKLGFIHDAEPRVAEDWWLRTLDPVIEDPVGYSAKLTTGRFWLENTIRSLADSYEAQGDTVGAVRIRRLGNELGFSVVDGPVAKDAGGN